MFGHWWHHLFLQIVILTDWDGWHESPTLIIAYLKLTVFPSFVKLYECACRETFLLWHELDLPLAILFIIFLPSALLCVLDRITKVL